MQLLWRAGQSTQTFSTNQRNTFLNQSTQHHISSSLHHPDISQSQTNTVKNLKNSKFNISSITNSKHPPKKTNKKDQIISRPNSRKFLGSLQQDLNTSREKQNIYHRNNKQNITSSISKSKIRFSLTNTCNRNLEQCKQASEIIKCIPPQLYISRDIGKIQKVIQGQNFIKKIYSDGRFTMYYRNEQIFEQYYKDIQIVKYKNGDFKVEWQKKKLYWCQQLQIYELNGKIIEKN